MGLSFDGTDDVVDFGDVVDQAANDAFSIALWVKRNATGEKHPLVAKQEKDPDSDGNQENRGYIFWIDNNNRLVFSLSEATGPDIGTNVELFVRNSDTQGSGVWNHFAVTYDGSATAGGVTLYKDATALSNDTTVDSLDTTSTTTNAGNLTYARGIQRGDNAFSFANIQMAYAVVWNIELTAQQVQSIMHRRLYSDDEVDIYVPLDEGEGTTAHDYKQTNDGAITGATWDATSEPPVTDTAGGGVI